MKLILGTIIWLFGLCRLHSLICCVWRGFALAMCMCSFKLPNAELTYVSDETRYLGVVITAASRIDARLIRWKTIYRCLNAIDNRAKHADSALVCVRILASFMLYAVAAILLSKTVFRKLENLINRAVYRIVGYSTGDDIKYIRSTVDLSSLEDTVYRRNVKFIRSFRENGLSFADHVWRVCNMYSA